MTYFFAGVFSVVIIIGLLAFIHEVSHEND